MIRMMAKSDVPACVEIVRDNWSIQIANRFYDEVQHSWGVNMKWPPQYFVYEKDKQVAGFAGMMPSWRMHNAWDFIWINIKLDYQGQGMGHALTRYRIQKADMQGASVIELMTRNPEFFETLGFKRHHDYEGGWVSMGLQLRKMEL